LIQLRAKHVAAGDMLTLAERLAARARAAGARCVVNDRLDVAILARADGLHVGQEDLSPSSIEQVLAAQHPRPTLFVGLSTHNDAQVRAGLEQAVGYLAIGPVFATSTKTRPDPVVGLGGVRHAAALTGPRAMPLVAIGGIGRANARAVIEAGATSVVVAGDLTGDDPGERARALLTALER
jgi:thiamine-phosphate pyrophosphorylase